APDLIARDSQPPDGTVGAKPRGKSCVPAQAPSGNVRQPPARLAALTFARRPTRRAADRRQVPEGLLADAEDSGHPFLLPEIRSQTVGTWQALSPARDHPGRCIAAADGARCRAV